MAYEGENLDGLGGGGGGGDGGWGITTYRSSTLSEFTTYSNFGNTFLCPLIDRRLETNFYKHLATG